MIRLGRTYGNLMVDVVASNAKLRARARRAVELATEVSDADVDAALAAAGGDAKVAIVSLAHRPRPGRGARATRRRRRRGPPCGGGIVRLGVHAAVVDGVLLRGDVEVEDGRIAAVGVNGGGGSGIAIPGLVDLQVNGFGGVDFASADIAGYRRAGEALLESGVTAFQPTLITAPEEELVAALTELPREPIGPRVIGAHLEGPFLSPLRLGAHPVDSPARPRPGAARTPARHRPGLGDDARAGARRRARADRPPHARGVVASCGHSDATAEQAGRAFDRGAATVTHLFNAMRPLGHRDPGIAGAALARDDVIVQVILDGHHLAEETARVVWRAAAGRIALVSDAIAAAGVGDGSLSARQCRGRGARRGRAPR